MNGIVSTLNKPVLVAVVVGLVLFGVVRGFIGR